MKICLRIDVEDGEHSDSEWTDADHLSQRLFRLATVIGANAGRGAKLSVQFGRNFLDPNDDVDFPYPGIPTSLSGVLEQGGNFWSHNHDSSYEALTTRHSLVLSAFEFERNGSSSYTMGAPFGRSGGAGVTDPMDWVSITQARGLRFMNGMVMLNHNMVDVVSRPYALDDTQLLRWYYHHPAPGPLVPEVNTMRMRPFYATVASDWFREVSQGSVYYVNPSSVLLIPHPSRGDLTSYDDSPSSDVKTLTDNDLKGALTEIWDTFKLWTAGMRSIHGVWYAQLSPEYIDDNTISLVGNWVDSINQMLNVNGGGPVRAEWRNMNEIGSIFVNSPYRNA